MADWQPLVTDPARRAELVAVIRQIVDAIPVPAHDDISLHVDRAITRAYLAQDETVGDPDDEVGSSLAAAITGFAVTPLGPALYGGACGVGWTVEHLAGGDTAESVCAAVDRALLEALEDWTGYYDLIPGLVGFGVYALERGEAGRAVANRVIDHLERTARPQGSGLGWFTPPELLPDWQRALSPEGYWNLGLAHGIPGVIGFLARCVRHDVDRARARTLLDGAMAYLLATPPSTTGRFPAWLPSNTATKRVAWCYGDLGVSFAILAAAQACSRDDWRQQALVLARECARDEDPIRDTGLCHGTAGALHMFARLWNATREQAFADAAIRWLDRTISNRRTDDYAGFPSYEPEGGVDRFVPSASILVGAPGVVLALQAAISQVEPTWDRVMLIDI